MDRRGVPFNKVAGFGSDGASVMTGLGKRNWTLIFSTSIVSHSDWPYVLHKQPRESNPEKVPGLDDELVLVLQGFNDTWKGTPWDSWHTNNYPLMAHTFYTMAHTNLKWPIDLCQHGAIGPLTFFLPNHCASTTPPPVASTKKAASLEI